MRTSELLRKAWLLIDAKHKWIQGTESDTLTDPNGNEYHAYCMVGALSSSSSDSSSDEYWEAKGFLIDAIPDNQDEDGCQIYSDIPDWNDEDDREWWEVRNVWHRAVELAENAELMKTQTQLVTQRVEESDLAVSGD